MPDDKIKNPPPGLSEAEAAQIRNPEPIILIVEDEALIVEVLKNILTGSGYAPLAVASGEEAIQRAVEVRPDLVLMDIHLAGEIDGVEAVEQIRAHLDIPVIYLSGNADEVSVQRAKITEPYSFLVKPVQEKELLATITTTLYKHQMEGKLKESEERLRSFMAAATESFSLWDADLNLVTINEAGLGFFPPGTGKEAMIGKNILEISPGLEETGLYDQALQVIETGAPLFAEPVVPHPKFGEVFLTVRAFKVGDGLGATVADVTEQKRAEEALRQHNRNLVLLNRAGRAFISSLDLDQVFSTVLEGVRHMLEVVACSIWLVDPETNELVCRQVTDPQSEVVRGWRLAPGEGLAGWVVRHGESLNVPDIRTDERHYKGVDQQTGLALRSILTVPLQVKENVIGVIQAVDEEAGRFTPNDLRLLESLAAFAVIAIENARIYDLAQQEITARMQAQAALQKSETRYKRLLESVTDYIYTVQVESGRPRATSHSPGCEAVTGYTPEEYEADPQLWHRMVYGKDQPAVMEQATGLLSGEMMPPLEHRITHKNGSIRWVRNTPVLRYDKKGRFVAYDGLISDVTEHKQAEEALRESEQQLSLIYDSTGDVLYYLAVEPDDCFRFLSVNPAFLEATGLAEDQIVGKRIEEVIPEPSIRMVRDNYKKAIEETGIACWEEASEYPAGVKVGEVSIAPIFDDNGICTHLVGSVHDITQRKQAEEALQKYSARQEERVEERTRELKEAQEQLVRQEKLAVLGQLAGGVGHELRNPMTALSNAAYFLQLTLPEAGETTREYLDIIASEVRRSEKIVSDLLGFARTGPAEREEIAVLALIDPLLKQYPPPPGVQVSTDIAVDLPPVFVDPGQIEVVLVNLVTNAYQAMPAGGRLSVQAGGNQDKVSLSITDTGTGISRENLEKLFEPLFTTKARGIGLGLAVSKNLVEANGGSIEVESEAGKGSTFRTILPIKGNGS